MALRIHLLNIILRGIERNISGKSLLLMVLTFNGFGKGAEFTGISRMLIGIVSSLSSLAVVAPLLDLGAGLAQDAGGAEEGAHGVPGSRALLIGKLIPSYLITR